MQEPRNALLLSNRAKERATSRETHNIVRGNHRFDAAYTGTNQSIACHRGCAEA